MNFTMTDEVTKVVYTGEEWMGLKPEERLRLISLGGFTYRKG